MAHGRARPARPSGVEIEDVTASCLTTFGTYARRFYRPGEYSSTPPDIPVWVVEIKRARGACAAGASRGGT